MEKNRGILILLIVFLIISLVIIGILYFNNKSLKSQNNFLESERTKLSNEKEQVITEREQCRNDVQNLNSKLSMLQEDVSKIYRGCITENACKGHYPGIRWNCNNVGDETNINASHTCVCDSSCNLSATEIKK